MYCYLLILNGSIFIPVESSFFALDDYDFFLRVVSLRHRIMQLVHPLEPQLRDLRCFQYLIKCYSILINVVKMNLNKITKFILLSLVPQTISIIIQLYHPLNVKFSTVINFSVIFIKSLENRNKEHIY